MRNKKYEIRFMNSYFTFQRFKNDFAIIVLATNLRHLGAFLVSLMTFLMKVYHAMNVSIFPFRCIFNERCKQSRYDREGIESNLPGKKEL